MMENILSWDTLWYVLLILYVPACFGLIVIVLLQKGKGTGFAGAFGAGAGPGSEAVFGPKAGQTLPVKLTYLAASLFMVIAVVMSIIAGRVGRDDAPDKVDVSEESTISSTAALSEYGLGTGVIDATRHTNAPPPPETAAPQNEGTETDQFVESASPEPDAESGSEEE